MADFLADHGALVAVICALLAVVYGVVTTRSLLALSRLQMFYAQRSGGAQPTGAAEAPQDKPEPEGPGPAQSSGRLWVPGQ